MNERVIKNPNFKSNGEFHQSLAAKGVGAKDWPNTHTEVEYLGNRKFAASIGVGHQVFFDKADGNKPKKHKLTDERSNGKDYVLIQGAKCCVEVYPYYAKYFDVQHEEVRLYEERWVVQRLFKEPDEWRDVDAYNPQIAVEEYSEPAGDMVKVTVTYDTDYGTLTIEYFQRDRNALKHNVTFKNTSGGTETFRVLQRWAGIVGTKVNGKDFPLDVNEPFLAFGKVDGKLTIAENLWSMIFNSDGSEKKEKYLQRPVQVGTHSQGMKADFVYGNWILAQNESLEIDPDTATLSDPTEDGTAIRYGTSEISFAEASIACPTGTQYRDNAGEGVFMGGKTAEWTYSSFALRGYVEWDISSLAGKSLTANPIFKYEGGGNLATSGEINPIAGQPSTATDADLFADIASGTAYVDPFNVVGFPNQTQDLGASAKTDLQTAMDASRSWFAIGFQSPDDECPSELGGKSSDFLSEEGPAPEPKPTLYVVYTTPPSWTGKISGVTNPAKIMGVPVTKIAKVKGVPSA